MEDFGGGYLAGDCGEVVEGFAEVLGEEVGGGCRAQAVEEGAGGDGGGAEGVGVAGVGDEDGVFVAGGGVASGGVGY